MLFVIQPSYNLEFFFFCVPSACFYHKFLKWCQRCLLSEYVRHKTCTSRRSVGHAIKEFIHPFKCSCLFAKIMRQEICYFTRNIFCKRCKTSCLLSLRQKIGRCSCERYRYSRVTKITCSCATCSAHFVRTLVRNQPPVVRSS